MQTYKLISLAGVFSIALALSACDASVPSQVYTGKIRVKDQMVTETLDAKHADPARIHILADNILRNSKGAITLTVPYLSGDPTGAAAAEKQGIAYKKALEQKGVANIHMVTVPLGDKRYTDKIVISYSSLVALPPKDCGGALPGSQGGESLDAMEKYHLGCETGTTLSRMIADPSDLMGKAGTQDNDSRRVGETVETYKSGTPNEPMQGFQASTIGAQ